MLARFTFTRDADGWSTVTVAEAVPVQIVLGAAAVTVRPADPATYRRVTAVLDSRGRWRQAWASSPADRGPRTRLGGRCTH